MEMKITLSQAEVRSILAEYIENNLDADYTVHPSNIEFELTDVYEDRPGGGKTTAFHQVTANAKKMSRDEVVV